MAFNLKFENDNVRMGRSAHAQAYKRTATFRRRQMHERREAAFRLALWALFTVAVLTAATLGSH